MSAFKAYDIRGVYGKDFTAETVYRIGRELPSLLNASRVLVGRDARPSSPEIFRALCRGITEAGAEVDDMGLCTTPMTYYFTGRRGYDAAVMITASHNPTEYNGLKISRTGALPVGGDSGLKELEERVMRGGKRRADAAHTPSAAPHSINTIDVVAEYCDFLKGQLPNLEGLDMAMDCSNGMAALLVHDVFGTLPHYLFDTIDGTFPNHSPNPLEESATQPLRDYVLEKGLDIGVIFDGDADRVMFVDERGRFVRPDLLIALLAEYYLKRESGATVLFDVRTSRGVKEAIERMGGKSYMWKVGHAFAKVKLRELNAIVGGELAGHYYFRDFYCCDSAMLCAGIVLGVVAEAKRYGKTFSRLLADIDVYANTGECNHVIENKREAMEALRAWAGRQGTPTAFYDFDGYRFEWDDWWFSVRPSNTEPYLRTICEARTPELLAQKQREIETILEKT